MQAFEMLESESKCGPVLLVTNLCQLHEYDRIACARFEKSFEFNVFEIMLCLCVCDENPPIPIYLNICEITCYVLWYEFCHNIDMYLLRWEFISSRAKLSEWRLNSYDRIYDICLYWIFTVQELYIAWHLRHARPKVDSS